MKNKTTKPMNGKRVLSTVKAKAAKAKRKPKGVLVRDVKPRGY